jgi:uncharacterized membrane protein YeaQ/YmgE (transglycosylase-associated protein family)
MASMFWMILIGLAAGALAKLILPGRDPGGILITILLGIGGALVAGYLARSLGSYRGGEQVGLIASVIGSIVLLMLYRLFASRRPV